jgi:hypothetical protein
MRKASARASTKAEGVVEDATISANAGYKRVASQALSQTRYSYKIRVLNARGIK